MRIHMVAYTYIYVHDDHLDVEICALNGDVWGNPTIVHGF
jgi:hypothetical protein